MRKNKEYYTFNEYIKHNKLTPSEEDYMEMIYRLFLKQDNITVSDISKYLNITPPSVSKMIKKLSSKDLIIYEKYGEILLSDNGKLVGEQLLNRHNTINDFLKIIGLKEDIHEETEKIEHTVSVETLIKIKELNDFFELNNSIIEEFRNYQENKIK